MSEDIIKQLDEWDKTVQAALKDAMKASRETEKEMKKTIDEISVEGKKFIITLDKEIAKAETETKEYLEEIKTKTNKSLQALEGIWK